MARGLVSRLPVELVRLIFDALLPSVRRVQALARMCQYTYRVYLGHIGPYRARVREGQLTRYLNYCKTTPHRFRAVSFANTSITDSQLARVAPRDGRFYQVCLDGCVNITSKSLRTTLAHTPRLSLFGTNCCPRDIARVIHEDREMDQPEWVMMVMGHLLGMKFPTLRKRIPFVQIPNKWHVRESLLFAMLRSHGDDDIVSIDMRNENRTFGIRTFNADAYLCHHIPTWISYDTLVVVVRACMNFHQNNKHVVLMGIQMPVEWDNLPTTYQDLFLPVVVDRSTMQLRPGEILY